MKIEQTELNAKDLVSILSQDEVLDLIWDWTLKYRVYLRKMVSENSAMTQGYEGKYEEILRFLREQNYYNFSLLNERSLWLDFKIIYSVDCNEIHQFCFPFGFSAQLDRVNISNLAYQQEAYQYFFENYIKTDTPEGSKPFCFLLDEYKPEFQSLKRLFEMTNVLNDKEQTLLIESIQRLERGESLKDKEEYLYELFNAKFSLLFSILSGFHKKAGDRWTSLITDKIIQDFEKSDIDFNERIIDGFDFNRRGMLSDALWHQLEDCRISILKKLYPDFENEDLSSPKQQRDFQAIERIIEINNYFGQEHPYDNTLYILLHFSSTKKTNELKNNNTVFKQNLPRCYSQVFNPLRRIEQVYLDSVTTNNNLESFDQAFEKIRILKNLYESKKLSPERAKYDVFKDTFDFIQKNIDEKRDSWREDRFKANYVEKFRQEFLNTELIKKMNSQGINLSLICEKILTEIQNDTDFFEQVKELSYFVKKSEEITVSYTFQEVLSQSETLFEKEAPLIRISKDDHIWAINHHLPILFWIDGNEKYLNGKLYIINQIVDLMTSTKLGNEYREDIKRFFKNIKLSYDKKSEKTNVYESENIEVLENKLVLYLLIILTPRDYTLKLEEVPYDKKVLSEITSDILDVRDKKVNNLEIREGSPEIWEHYLYLLQNLRYMKVWLLRRVGQFERSIKIANLAIKTYTDFNREIDPRFCHGISLSYYCIYREFYFRPDVAMKKYGQKDNIFGMLEVDQVKVQRFLQIDEHSLNVPDDYEAINRAIKYSELADKQYISFKDKTKPFPIFQKSYSALLNSFSFYYCLLYEEKKKRKKEPNEELKKSRKIIDEKLRNNSVEKKKDGELFPLFTYEEHKSLTEFQYAEAYLECMEMMEMINRKEHKSDIEKKMICTQNSVDFCKKHYHNRFSQVTTDADSLENRIWRYIEEIEEKLQFVRDKLSVSYL